MIDTNVGVDARQGVDEKEGVDEGVGCESINHGKREQLCARLQHGGR